METTKEVWKYILLTQDKQTLILPRGAEILHIGCQNGRPYVWALVDVADVMAVAPRDLTTYGTGHEIKGPPGTYHGTYLLDEGKLVFHVFETTYLACSTSSE